MQLEIAKWERLYSPYALESGEVAQSRLNLLC